LSGYGKIIGVLFYSPYRSLSCVLMLLVPCNSMKRHTITLMALVHDRSTTHQYKTLFTNAHSTQLLSSKLVHRKIVVMKLLVDKYITLTTVCSVHIENKKINIVNNSW